MLLLPLLQLLGSYGLMGFGASAAWAARTPGALADGMAVLSTGAVSAAYYYASRRGRRDTRRRGDALPLDALFAQRRRHEALGRAYVAAALALGGWLVARHCVSGAPVVAA